MTDDTQQQDRSATATISVIIPTKNGAATLRELLAALRIQTRRPDEILVIDSASDDDSVAVAEAYGAIVHRIGADDFDHGATRSLGAKMTHGEVLVYFTQDVLPADRAVIENLVAPLLRHKDVAMSYGRQLPAFGADELAAHLRCFNYPPEPAIREFADREQLGLAAIFASNSCAAYRRSMLAETGFFPDGLIFGEDTWVAGRLLMCGYKIAYAADAAVYHSHNQSRQDEFRRYFDIGVLHETENWLLTTYGGAGGRGIRYIKSGIISLGGRRSYSALAEFMVRVALKWVGYQMGRRFRLLPRSVAIRLSLNRNWWSRRAID
ncbi:glycosyltransferase family 2 protein [Desulfofustis glycolicus]|uniref:Rhamnosyltransferase n=1 Tax=Desulfofustis glycolicus DSM 9705 TaxID=1121409 RepID=A0A1M5WUE5_9BACT|nr:glycosyltransferase family A protein [Desulfofustis glycolicus]MCB2214434.1 glycosyltransferase [Desulfobulbaceae bacterium]SHH91111.1 rhamnosyltransferase [Desulfofustis glycolicus DSM 9705]